MRLAVLLAIPSSRATAVGPSSEATVKQSRIDRAIETDRSGSSVSSRAGTSATPYRASFASRERATTPARRVQVACAGSDDAAGDAGGAGGNGEPRCQLTPYLHPRVPTPHLGREFKPFELGDPFPFYARARAQAPIFHSPDIDYWVVTRYEDIRAIFRDPATFSSENTQSPFRQRPAEVQRILDDGGFSVTSGLSGRQPPDHTRLRGFIKQAFTPRRVASLEPEIRAITSRMIDRFADRGHADLVGELAHELPALVIFRMLGIPDEDVPQVKEWAQSRVYMNFGDAPVQEQTHHAENLVRYWRYCRELVQARLADPQDDLPGDLARIYLQGDQTLTPDEIAGLVYGQLTAGHETTTALLANGLKELLGQRPAWEAVCADPEQIPAAVEEMLRISAPVFTWKRLTKRPVTIGGVDLPAQTNLLLLLGSANHDEEVFPRGGPDRPRARERLAPPGLRAGHPLLPGCPAGPPGGQGGAAGAHPPAPGPDTRRRPGL